MLWTKHLMTGYTNHMYDDDYEDCLAHEELKERIRKTLYYGKSPDTDRHSLPVTELAVEYFQDAAPRQFGKVDTDLAASYSRRACISPSSLMLSMIYIERLKHRNPEYLQTISSADLFLISMMVSSKYLYDDGIDEEVFNDEWAESAKMDIEDLNTLERQFLQAMDWQLFVAAECFWSVLMTIERELALRKGWEHGTFTYTDSWVLSDQRFFDTLQQLIATITKVFLVCSVAYIGCVLSMVAATASVSVLRLYSPSVMHNLRLPYSSTPASSTLEPTHLSDQDITIGDIELLSLDDRLNDVFHDHASKSDSSVDTGDLPHRPETTSTVHRNERNLKPSPKATPWMQHKKRSRTSVKRHGIALPSIGLPSLVTLTLTLRDALIQFATAVHDRVLTDTPDRDDSWYGDGDYGNIVCACGACPAVSDYRCKNSTGDGAMERLSEGCPQCTYDQAWHQTDNRRHSSDTRIPTDHCLTRVEVCMCCCPEDAADSLHRPISTPLLTTPLYDVIHTFSTAASWVT